MIRITKDAILCVEMDDSGIETSFDILKTDNGIVSYLDQYVIIDEGVSVSQFLSILADVKEEINYVFDSSMNGYSLDTYLPELAEPSTNDGSLIFTEIVHDVDMSPNRVISELKYFRGVGPVPATGRLGNFNLELLPVSFYKDLPIVLNHNYVVQRTEVVDGTQVTYIELQAQKGFTLFEVVYAILFEISYHGTPEARQQLLEQFLSVVEEAQSIAPQSLPEAAEAGKDAEITRSNAELENALKEENYEKAAELRDQIKNIS